MNSAQIGRRKIAAPGAPASRFPHDVAPMLATLGDKPFDHPDWIFETKWDGYRAIAEIERGRVRLYSRYGQSFAERYTTVVESLRDLGHNAVLDGEVVVFDEQGRSQFQLLQSYQNAQRGRLVYCVFDLLHLDGRDLTSLPLIKRKKVLRKLLKNLPHVMYSEHIATTGEAFFKATVELGLEGMMAKYAVSTYKPGLRSRDWLKVKTHRRQEAVIAGFTEPRKTRKEFGALVLGVYDGKDLNYIGHTGSGFNSQSLAETRRRLRPLETDRCPFREVPKTNMPVHWVRPSLVCEVEFQEWTSDGRMRIPIFVGLRDDKPARSVKREKEVGVKPKKPLAV
jgi:bifunctional non-homologous end joining protein LigD